MSVAIKGGNSMSDTQAEKRFGTQRLARLALGFALTTAVLLLAQAGTAQASTTCAWGGTPAAPTGTFTIDPGITNVPSGSPLKFVATGTLSGADQICRGQVKFVGQIDPPASCLLPVSFEGTVQGLPGVARWWGKGNFDVPSYLYDKDGNLVGTENAQIVTQDNASQFLDCNTPGGFTGPATFSSNIVLFN
jgi:hypothetical protein